MSVVGADSVPSKSHSPGPLAPTLILCPPLTPRLPFKSELSPGSQGPFYRVSAAFVSARGQPGRFSVLQTSWKTPLIGDLGVGLGSALIRL